MRSASSLWEDFVPVEPVRKHGILFLAGVGHGEIQVLEIPAKEGWHALHRLCDCWVHRSLTADSPGIILDARSTSENYHMVRDTFRERVREYCEVSGSVVADISAGYCRQGSVPRFEVQ